MKKNYIPIISFLGILIARPVLAHCPLCTAGAGLAALGASYLGIGSAPIGVFIGAFGVALGLWIGRLIKKQYIPQQKAVITVSSFATTVLPLMPLMQEYSSLYFPTMGEYGRTFLVNRFLVGALLGAVLMLLSPAISKKLTLWRGNKSLPFQGLVTTFVLLAIGAAVFELWIW